MQCFMSLICSYWVDDQYAEASGACTGPEAARKVSSPPLHGNWIWTLADQMVPKSHAHMPAVELHSFPSSRFSQTCFLWQRLGEAGLASSSSEV